MRLYILIGMLLFNAGCTSLQSPKETNVAVGTLLDEIQIAINEINSQTKGSSLPPFKHAEVVLTTKTGKTDEGAASLVLSAEGKRSMNTTNTLTLVLAPDPSPQKTLIAGTGKLLANNVVAAVSAIDDKSYLKLKTLIVEAGFNVTVKASGGIEIEVASISLSGKTTRLASDGHKLKLVFE